MSVIFFLLGSLLTPFCWVLPIKLGGIVSCIWKLVQKLIWEGNFKSMKFPSQIHTATKCQKQDSAFLCETITFFKFCYFKVLLMKFPSIQKSWKKNSTITQTSTRRLQQLLTFAVLVSFIYWSSCWAQVPFPRVPSHFPTLPFQSIMFLFNRCNVISHLFSDKEFIL